MDDFARLPASERRLACLATADAKRLQAASVDKDFWVCWTLRALFSLPDIDKRITFKGGTSLSKTWGLIDRFSEDIDLVVDKDDHRHHHHDDVRHTSSGISGQGCRRK
ncbi:MAG: nucleotidyl transferase AbiEii/AbiGii toxin family protein [Burkholderiales bacterium]|nr:nucleotidyl transferase AbiEii/AbiGii toxin family protein [Burkholderiales bacterium]